MEAEQKLRNLIKGALKSTIDAHGPITPEWIGSAEKRVFGAVMGELKAKKEDEVFAEGELEGIPPSVVIESREDHDKRLLADIEDLIDARTAIMDALGNGADKELWKPGDYYLLAFRRWVAKMKGESFEPKYVCLFCGYDGNSDSTGSICPQCGKAMRYLGNKVEEG